MKKKLRINQDFVCRQGKEIGQKIIMKILYKIIME